MIKVSLGDITRFNGDAIVNAANETLGGGGGVDGAIHRAAGPRLLQTCLAMPELTAGVRCPTGTCRVTPAFDLPCRYVIHTAGPVWRGGQFDEPKLLAACYRNAIGSAESMGISSVAIPAISCGIYGYPLEEAAKIAVSTLRASLVDQTTIKRVELFAFDDAIKAVIENQLAAAETI